MPQAGKLPLGPRWQTGVRLSTIGCLPCLEARAAGLTARQCSPRMGVLGENMLLPDLLPDLGTAMVGFFLNGADPGRCPSTCSSQ